MEGSGFHPKLGEFMGSKAKRHRVDINGGRVESQTFEEFDGRGILVKPWKRWAEEGWRLIFLELGCVVFCFLMRHKPMMKFRVYLHRFRHEIEV